MVSARAAVARIILGLPVTQQDEQQLLLRCSSKSGCLGVLGILWLMPWCAMLAVIARDVWKGPDHSGIFALMLIGGVTFGMGGFIIKRMLPGEELRLDEREILIRRRQPLFYKPVRRFEIDRITNVSIAGAADVARGGGGHFLAIEAGPECAIFGRHTPTYQLILWERLLRARLGNLTSRPLAADPGLDQIHAQLTERNQRIKQQAMAAVGVSSEAEISNDSERSRAVARKARELTIAELTGRGVTRVTPDAPTSPLQQIGRWIIEVVRWIFAAFFLVIMSVWILGVVGATIQTFQHPRVVMFFVLPIFWVVTLGFMFVIYGVIKAAVAGTARLLKKLAFGR